MAGQEQVLPGPGRHQCGEETRHPEAASDLLAQHPEGPANAEPVAALPTAPERSLARQRGSGGGAAGLAPETSAAVRSRWRAFAISDVGRVALAVMTKRTIIRRPPNNSLAVNCWPISTASTIPSTITRLVEANMKTIAVTKLAPSENRDLAIAADA